jgi:hypothetical protein
MVLDNWGTVDRWIAEEKITSRGPSGIGFVNFGTINSLCADRNIRSRRARLQRLYRLGEGCRAAA